jgi:hypothetical protein
MRKFKCSDPGCINEATDLRFIHEAALVGPSTAMLTRKPLAVQRVFSGTCTTHGKVTLIADGHQVTERKTLDGDRVTDTVGYEANKEWQSVAFAVMMLHEGD